ncbi:MAG TPA: aldo/keto reductase [Bacteroidales bacterium]|nr:aldo/keto reductase [Bacteroidales bacterium]
MIFRDLGDSGIEVSAIAFGAWAIGGFMWGGNDDKEAIRAIQHGYDLDMTTIDTAPIYGMGLSEELVGKAIQGKRERFQILTKFGIKWKTKGTREQFRTQKEYEELMNQIYLSARKESVIQECEDSLRRLNTDYIDYYQHHRPAEDAPVEEVMEALEKLKDQGKIRAAGVSNYSMDQMKKANKRFRIETNQLPYSMVKRNIESDIIPWVLQNNKGVIAYSPLQRGVLTGKYSPGSQLAEGDHRKNSSYFKADNIRKINDFLGKIEPVARDHNASLAQLVLYWTIHQPGITIALAGARNPRQVEDNARTADISLSDQEMKTINNYLENLELDMQ